MDVEIEGIPDEVFEQYEEVRKTGLTNTNSIDGGMTCCKDGRFDDYGFPINECTEFENCERIKEV